MNRLAFSQPPAQRQATTYQLPCFSFIHHMRFVRIFHLTEIDDSVPAVNDQVNLNGLVAIVANPCGQAADLQRALCPLIFVRDSPE